MAEQPVTFQSLVTRARTFAEEWADETAERAEKDTFWGEFFAIFGIRRRRVATFEYAAERHSTGNRGAMDVFWPGKLAIEHKSAGKDLDEAMTQLFDYLQGPSITDAELPELAVVCDFQNWVVRDLDTNEEHRFTLDELPDRMQLFGTLAGFTQHRYSTEDEASAEAAELLGRIHDELVDAGYSGHELRVLLVRLLFLLFADDTRVWPDGPGLFTTWIHERTRHDGTDLGHHLGDWFELLNTPQGQRSGNVPDELSNLPYVNGGLFEERIPLPFCNPVIRERLLEAGRFDWSAISPAVFGSMFQSVMDPEVRRNLGALYSSEENIRKLIDPLFLDDLRAELDACGNGRSWQSKQKLADFHDKLSTLNFFDPACGCGNFLVITFREIRRLELEIHRRLNPGNVQLSITALADMNKIRLSQFHGIEIEEFPARIAGTAMWLAEHLANLELGDAFGAYYADFPLRDTASIHQDNALWLDWSEVLAAEQCTYLFGNPPFIGRKMINDHHRAELEHVWGDRLTSNIDYVSAWFAKAIDYLDDYNDARWGFVTTSSLCQGEGVPTVWAAILKGKWRCRFAHRSVKWTSEARGAAVVHVSIVGFDRNQDAATAQLYTYDNNQPTLRDVPNISPYLFPGPNVIVLPERTPLTVTLPEVAFGNMPRDDGNLLVELGDYEEFAADPVASKYLRRFIGARELLHGEDRWCLWLENMQPGDRRASQLLSQRLSATRSFRLQSKAASTREAADYPHLFVQRAQPTTNYLAIPGHTSENRSYLPVGFCSPEVICSNALFSAPDPTGFLFGVISSAMFMAWQQSIGGRLENRVRFSKTLTYNTFPLPTPTATQRERVESCGADVLVTRSKYDATLAELYDPLGMPKDLVDAHRKLDRAVEAIFGRTRHTDDESRLKILLSAYAELARSESALFEEL